MLMAGNGGEAGRGGAQKERRAGNACVFVSAEDDVGVRLLCLLNYISASSRI